MPGQTRPSSDTSAIASTVIEIASSEGKVAKNVLLMPFGELRGRDGRGPWKLEDRAHAEQVIAATRQLAGKTQIMFDYDHQSVLAPPKGGTALAAGWIDPASLTVADDGIRGDVEWTDAAQNKLAAREYRYHSPHFHFDKLTRRIKRLVNAGLTNSPNLDLPALASADHSADGGASQEEGNPMPIAKLLSATALTALGLTADSEDDAAINAIDELIKENSAAEGVLASVRSKLSVDEDADEAAICSAIESAGSGEPDPAKYVPIGDLKEVKDQLATINEERVIASVDGAIKAGKLTPGQRDWAIRLGKQDMVELNSFLETAPTFEGGKVIEGKPDSNSSKLTDEERAVCSTMGWSEEDFLEQKKKEAA